MKKIFSSLALLLATMTLVACGANTSAPTSTSSHPQTTVVDDDQTAKATFLVTANGKTTEKEVTFEVGDSVMDVLEDNFAAEEEDGMVTVIDGVSQDASKNTYWMYKVNNEMAEVGAESYKLKAGDKVEFYLETF
ncbi:DUF4430 domain-containing protein [Streptococcus merionis]|uniref:Lipoprotein n=1 Tax=Streptococcus merionis TaxID=400065 RepID=A0A239SSL2_9STRE|nr:DUF4430 domain-containing protein [Streptococcus merionis]SNU88471.1 lipoprotein [Streptococcus merionis]